jgi:hypothetical protein
MRAAFALCILSLFALQLHAQTGTLYPDIPRVDVHTHAGGDYNTILNYLNLRDILLHEYEIDLAMWVNLSSTRNPITSVDSVALISEGRMLCAFADYAAARGLKHRPEDLERKLGEGFIGYKIWYGPYYRTLEEGEKGFPYVDDPANEAMFARMEELGILAASLHIADPNGPFGNRTRWCADPVEFWREISGLYQVLNRHPDLKVVAAHGAWLVCQDAQIDYLRFLLSTFPNFHVDLAATFQYFNMVNYENLRDFMIEYADRILFGTDMGQWEAEEETQQRAQAYVRCFRILESDAVVDGSFFSDEPIRGLNLPREVLEKIYYRNALRLYPHLSESKHF